MKKKSYEKKREKAETNEIIKLDKIVLDKNKRNPIGKDLPFTLLVAT